MVADAGKEKINNNGYDSETDEYLADINGFVNNVRGDLKTEPDEELHWTDIGWSESQLNIGFIGTISEHLSNTVTLSDTSELKVRFSVSVLLQFLKVWMVSSGQALLPWYYTLTMPPLVGWRVYTYTQLYRQYFCLDYCYFGNLAIFIILVSFPDNPQLLIFLFCIANGLLYTGAFSFRNSLVFHSIDKMTSTYIHSAPVFLSFGVRWFPDRVSQYWHTSFPSDLPPWNLTWNVIAPLVFCSAHAVFYTVLVYGILKPPEHIITSYRYLKAKKSTKKIFGANPPFSYFLIIQFAIVLLMTGVTIATYTYYYLHVLQVLVLVVVVTWNGSTYYVDVFRVSMTKIKSK